MDNRLAPASRKDFNRSASTLVGLASMVISISGMQSKISWAAVIILPMVSGAIKEGVPPPKKIVETVRPFVRAAIDSFGGLDILVNNAGLARFGPVDGETYESDWSLSMDVMLNAHQRMIRAALPFLRKSASPRIVNIASTEGLGATPMNSAYVAAKHGVIGLTRGMAVDLGKEGITVNCICPGPINTNITASIPDEDKQVFARRRTALRRYGEPHEVAHITLSCVMPAASYMTGAVIPVDGGLTIRNA